MVAEVLNASPSQICMVAAHVWDTIGAQSIGCSGALIARPGNAPLQVKEVPRRRSSRRICRPWRSKPSSFGNSFFDGWAVRREHLHCSPCMLRWRLSGIRQFMRNNPMLAAPFEFGSGFIRNTMKQNESARRMTLDQ